jgi:hypothetical protein
MLSDTLADNIGARISIFGQNSIMYVGCQVGKARKFPYNIMLIDVIETFETSWKVECKNLICRNTWEVNKPETADEGAVADVRLIQGEIEIEVGTKCALKGIFGHGRIETRARELGGENDVKGGTSKKHAYRNHFLMIAMAQVLFLGQHFRPSSIFKVKILSDKVNGIYGGVRLSL